MSALSEFTHNHSSEQKRTDHPIASARRVRCFAQHDRGKVMPQVDGVEYVSDPESAFDLFIAPRAPDAFFSNFVARSSNPAAPMVAFTDAFGPRADVVVKEPSAAALAVAISQVQPLARLTAEFAPLPTGIDRGGLLALALMYTRNCSLTGCWQPNDPNLIEYPLLRGVENARTLLEKMAEAGLVRRRFFQRVHTCSSCGSSRLHAREVCLDCHSSQLVECQLVHHYACAFQGPQPLFETANGYVCPKCHKQLRHYGVDYDKPGSVVTCADCNATCSEPPVGFTCLDCGFYTDGDAASHRDWYHYDILPDGVAALRSGQLPHAGTSAPISGAQSVRDFRLIVVRLIAVSIRYHRPLSICRIELDADALAKKVGARGVLQICSFLRDLIVENLESSDFVTLVPNATFICCLPETDRTEAESFVSWLRDKIGQSLRVPIETSIEVVEPEAAKTLLAGLQHGN